MKYIESPLSGLVARVMVKSGDKIKAGDVAVVLNVMKTEINVEAEVAGIVKEVYVKEWDEVDVGTPLLSLKRIEKND